MTCSACSAHVEKSVKKLDGVKSVNVNLLQNNMHVDFDETAVSVDDIINAVVSGGCRQKTRKERQQNRQRNFKYEVQTCCVACLPCAANVHFNGTYVGLAVFECVSRCGKRNNICTYANAVDVADNVCQQKILYNRF